MHIGCIEYTTPAVLCQGNFSGTLSRPFYRLAVCLSNYVCWVLLLFIRKRRFALVVYFFFFNEEYLIVPVDFIVALRRTKGRRRRTLRSPSPPSSGLHLLTPGDPLRRDIGLPRVYRDIGIRYPVQVDYCHFDVVFGCFVFDPVSFAFQTVLFSLCRLFFIIGWKKDAVCMAFTHVF